MENLNGEQTIRERGTEKSDRKKYRGDMQFFFKERKTENYPVLEFVE